MRIPSDAYRHLGAGGPLVSPVGFGCYRVDDRVPQHADALRKALLLGVNLIDTSTNYGDGHSEILVGKVLEQVLSSGFIDREQIVVVTKAGYVQGSNQEEAIRRMQEGRPWPEMTEYNADCWHCISPDFLLDQISDSLDRLRLQKVDVFLLHNPEYFLLDAEHRGVSLPDARDEFYRRMGNAFRRLDDEVEAGRVGCYGVSSNTFVVPHDQYDAVSLPRLLLLSGPGFRVVQLPMNPIELSARERIHTPQGQSVLEVARNASLGVLVNRPFNAFGARGLVRFAPIDWSAPRNWKMFRGNQDEAEAFERTRVSQLDSHLTSVFGTSNGQPVSRKVVLALLAQEGVTSVLAGMRESRYVDDIISAFS